MRARNPKLVLLLALVSLAGVAMVGDPSTLDGDGTGAVHTRLTVEQLEEFDAFELYWLGEEFDGLELSGIVRDLRPGAADEAAGMNVVDFLYGDCDAIGGGCALPLAVQVWPACRRNLSMYELAPGRPMPHEASRIRGVPAASFDVEDGDGRLELSTGSVTVVLFGDGPERVRRAAEGLRGTGARAAADPRYAVAPGEPLPPPVEGALEGRLSCDGP